MNELLKVDFKNAERPTVSGRGLHAALGVQTRYSDWFGGCANTVLKMGEISTYSNLSKLRSE